MAGKRQATTNLNHDNWDQEEEPEERGVFRQATEDVLKTRNIKKARRMVAGGPSAGAATGDAPAEPKSVFSGFSGFGKSNTIGGAKSPFSFLDNLAGPTTTATATTSATTKPMFAFNLPATDKPAPNIFGSSSSITTSTDSAKPTADIAKPTTSIFGASSISTTTDSTKTTTDIANKPTTSIFGNISNAKKGSSESLSSVFKTSPASSKSEVSTANAGTSPSTSTTNSNSETSQYHEAVVDLNKSVLKFLQEELQKNVLCILTPVFRDYEKHLKKLKDTLSVPAVSLPSVAVSSTSPLATFSLGKPSAPIGGSTSLFGKPANSTVTSGGGGTTTASTTPIFSFGAPASSVSTSTAASPAAPATSFSFGFASKPKASEAKATEDAPKPGGMFSFLSTEKKTETMFSSKKKSDEPPKTNGFEFKPKSNDEKPGFSIFSGFSKPTEAAGDAPPPMGLAFGSGSTPFSFGNIKPPAASSAAAVADEEAQDDEDKPPKVEFTQVKEDDAIYSKRCKVYIKKDTEYVDRGIGTLYLKPIKDSEKTQLIVRADTNLGNILINLILSDGIPCNRQGKNNVLMVWMPTPEETKATILLRVKTGEEADDLLNEIKKHIK
ncbi:hypothetical protein KR032_000379 [Drosophila birchii]|nr:hypothetical protein KR032_000379 [Drosophila birchii]